VEEYHLEELRASRKTQFSHRLLHINYINCFLIVIYYTCRKQTAIKNINPLGLFDDHFIMDKLTTLGDPLDKLNLFIDWNILENHLKHHLSMKTGISPKEEGHHLID